MQDHVNDIKTAFRRTGDGVVFDIPFSMQFLAVNAPGSLMSLTRIIRRASLPGGTGATRWAAFDSQGLA